MEGTFQQLMELASSLEATQVKLAATSNALSAGTNLLLLLLKCVAPAALINKSIIFLVRVLGLVGAQE